MPTDGRCRDKSPVGRSELDRTKRDVEKLTETVDTLQQTIHTVGSALETATEVSEYKAAQQVVFFASGTARAALLHILVEHKEDLDAVRTGLQDKGLKWPNRQRFSPPRQRPYSASPHLDGAWLRVGVSLQRPEAAGHSEQFLGYWSPSLLQRNKAPPTPVTCSESSQRMATAHGLIWGQGQEKASTAAARNACRDEQPGASGRRLSAPIGLTLLFVVCRLPVPS